MRVLVKFKKTIAAFLLLVFLTELVIPNVSYALTSGPSQPEMKGFAPIGSSDMVDLFSGDFSYNIPLLDAGGYPVNISYQSGGTMDDEASWVGAGWNLNVGAMNRQLRGIPDDFNGTDMQTREMNMKEHITKGARFSMTVDLFGVPLQRIKKKAGKKKKKNIDLTLTVSIGIKHDNYRGIGMDIGANTGLSLSKYTEDELTPTDDSLGLAGIGSLSGGLTLSSTEGAGFNMGASILSKNLGKADKFGASSSIGFGYNTRAGLTGMTLGNSFNSSRSIKDDKEVVKQLHGSGLGQSSFISFNGDSYSPTIDHPMKTNSFTFSMHLGLELFGAFGGIGATGFFSKQKVSQIRRQLPAYGFIHSEKGRDDSYALLDFNREKDIPYTREIKYMPIPIPTYDLFTGASQDGAGQYRAYRGSSGVFFDSKTETVSNDYQLGIEAGGGLYVDLGADLYFQEIKSKTHKWIDRNRFLAKGDFQADPSVLHERSFLKRIGEPVPADKTYFSKIKESQPTSVQLTKNVLNGILGAEATDNLRTSFAREGEATSVLTKGKREVRNTTFSYLTAGEAANHAVEKLIRNYHPDSLVLNSCNSNGIKSTISRTSQYRKKHHISEITVTGDDGKRNIYGLPVYNTYQEEVSFSVAANLPARTKGLTNYNFLDATWINQKGRENYYSKEVTPPYATSYLLTSILSPDYVDVSGNGITDDDLGTAVKFNYTKLDSLYNWRTPFARGADTANYNEGFLSDDQDDKANFVYGEKEVWYLHSIESKTMVAHFIMEDRKDGLGVINQRGELRSGLKLKRLKEIRLYSKSDLKLNNNNPSITIPIKVVHFEYDYSICKGLPNNGSASVDSTGKLTLKKIYFTFGQNQKGKLNPYEFSYDLTQYNFYDYRQYDRWGNFKKLTDNPGGMNNSEYPYTLQDTTLSNAYSRIGQLNKIFLPSGGSIAVHYESDDYAYVQDKRASQMCSVNGIKAQADSTGLIYSDYIYINLPTPVANRKEMLERYFEGITNLYFKFYMDVDNRNHKEFVPGYAEIAGVPELAPGTNNVAKIKLSRFKGVNPIARAGWQFLRMNLPKLAYPGSDNLNDPGSDLKKTILAMVEAFGSIKELIYGFEKRAAKKKYSDNVDLQKSFVRLCSPTWKKLGGGSRVKRVDISDDWANMSNTTGALTSNYSQVYDYTTKDGKGRIISSGVASYEPTLGNDENPFRQPVKYGDKQFLALTNYYYIEEPFCESLFPAASVGYSKVTVKSIGAGDAESVNRTGTVVSEFYTAKEYPTKVSILELQERKPSFGKFFKLIGGISTDMIGLSQGYSIELNDMHGKPSTVNVFNKSGQNISSVEYSYLSENEYAPVKKLKNDVKVIDAQGIVSDGTIGIDAEMYTDMREHTMYNLGVSSKISGGAGAIFFFPVPFFFPGLGVNYDQRMYRGASTIKIINRFAVQYKVKKIENGSHITTENLLWDAETGNVLLTKTQNEFNDPLYSFAYPAHWIYGGMGQAYPTLGTILSGFSSGSDGVISNETYRNIILFPGDELIDIETAAKYWVVNTAISGTYVKKIINENGDLQQISDRTLKLLRTGKRNMANTAIASITSLNNPIVGDKLNVSELSKVLDAKATVFNELWSVPVKSKAVPECGISEYCMQRFIQASMVTSGGVSMFYANTINPNISVQEIFDNAYGIVSDPCNNNFLNGKPANQVGLFQYNTHSGEGSPHILSGDSAKLGTCRLYFDQVTSAFTNLTNQYSLIDSILERGLTQCRRSIKVVSTPGVNCGFSVVDYPAPLAAPSKAQQPSESTMPLNSGPCGPQTTDTILKFRLVCPTICQDPVGNIINPYYTGVLGNWRTQSQYVYQVARKNLVSDPSKLGSTDIRRSGDYTVFSPFWKYGSKWDQVNDPSNSPAYNDNKWIAANEVTYFNSKGHEVENKDALDRYSAALFGYLESMPIAVASNTRFRELAFDGFEDYNFSLDCEAATDTCNNTGHFNFKKQLNGSTVVLNTQNVHSGKFSLAVNGNATLTKTAYSTPPSSIIEFDGIGRYLLQSNELVKGFSPIPGKKYVISCWVKDGQPRNPTTNVQVSVTGSGALIGSSSNWPIVEGWKRIELPFLFNAPATNFTIQLSSGSGTVYFDDIRIHPFDGQMKSFVYDPSSQRLMAELDENNFATFYEYDDEGILIRVKKETERGIMTIKETRSSYRKRAQ